MREFKSGDVIWSPAQTHIGENVGSTDTHVIIVEIKDKAATKSHEIETTTKPEEK